MKLIAALTDPHSLLASIRFILTNHWTVYVAAPSLQATAAAPKAPFRRVRGAMLKLVVGTNAKIVSEYEEVVKVNIEVRVEIVHRIPARVCRGQAVVVGETEEIVKVDIAVAIEVPHLDEGSHRWSRE